MLEEDGTISGVATYGLQEPNSVLWRSCDELDFPTERYREYRVLLRNVGAKCVFQRTGETRFVIEGSGFGSHGWRVGISYWENEPNSVVGSLSEFRPDGTSLGANTAYMPIDQHWYIWIVW